MSSDTVWKVVKRESGACVTPLRFHSAVEASSWVERNQPLFKEEILGQLFFLENEPLFYSPDPHHAFMKSVTGDNALTK